MPSGYTATLHAGEQSFQDFATQCARAFGAFYHLRDESITKGWRPNEVSDYHPRILADTKEELERLTQMSTSMEENLKLLYMEERQDEIKRREDVKVKRESIKSRYENMIREVSAWDPPTEEHQNLKDFMLEQLYDSLDWDCKDYAFENVEFPSFEMWHAEKLRRLLRDIEYHTKQYKEECEKVAARNAWALELFKSLGVENA